MLWQAISVLLARELHWVLKLLEHHFPAAETISFVRISWQFNRWRIHLIRAGGIDSLQAEFKLSLECCAISLFLQVSILSGWDSHALIVTAQRLSAMSAFARRQMEFYRLTLSSRLFSTFLLVLFPLLRLNFEGHKTVHDWSERRRLQSWAFFCLQLLDDSICQRNGLWSHEFKRLGRDFNSGLPGRLAA